MKKSQFKQEILLTKDVEQVTGINRVTLRRWWADGCFPVPVKLSSGVLAWHYDDIQQWINDRTKRASKHSMTFTEK